MKLPLFLHFTIVYFMETTMEMEHWSICSAARGSVLVPVETEGLEKDGLEKMFGQTEKLFAS